MMSEHQRETAFLRHCLRYDDSAEHQALDDRIARIQRDERCVRRAVWLMAVLTALAVAGFGYAAILIQTFPQDTTQLVARIIFALGLASVICLVAFVGLGMIYRLKLDQRREECRQLVTKLLDVRLGQPVATPWRDSRADRKQCETIPVGAGGNGPPDKTESTARG